ncbi:unnamed protein product [Adineta steineri]|uniref:Uncharacterized protein n=2 Tax=Adineta steineri TaxID=433720 RepID=A0A819Q9T9_9BILA|nr:unnamed protein product [Adineta steineri]CAF4021169.1 unnamed protein product [Adineta steineri]
MSRRASSTRKTTQNQNESTGESEEENEITPDYDRDTGTVFMEQFDACNKNVNSNAADQKTNGSPRWLQPTQTFLGASKTTQNQSERSESEQENEITTDYDRETGRFFMMQFNACGQSIGEFIKLCHATNYDIERCPVFTDYHFSARQDLPGPLVETLGISPQTNMGRYSNAADQKTNRSPRWLQPTQMFPGASKTIQNDNESSGESEEENISRDDDRDTGTLFMQQFDACEQNIIKRSYVHATITKADKIRKQDDNALSLYESATQL